MKIISQRMEQIVDELLHEVGGGVEKSENTRVYLKGYPLKFVGRWLNSRQHKLHPQRS